MLHRSSTLLSAVSLLLCVAACVLWVRSYLFMEGVWVVRGENRIGTYSAGGDVSLFWHTQPAEGGSVHWSRSDIAGTVYTRGVAPTLVHHWGGFGFQRLWRSWPPPTGRVVRVLAVPHWFLCIAFAVPPGRWVYRRTRGARLARSGLCPACGYDLRASPGRCPECGTVPPARI